MLRYSLALSRRLGMGWKQMQRVMDSEEIAYQMGLDLVEADERPSGDSTKPPTRRLERQWINLDDPNVFEKIKQRVGL